MLKMDYTVVKVAVSDRSRKALKRRITSDTPLAITIDVTREGDSELLLTTGQIMKLRRSIQNGSKSFRFIMSRKQVKVNFTRSGGFLATLLSLATRALPMLLGGLASTLLSRKSGEGKVSGDGLFLSRKGYGTAQLTFHGEGLLLSPVKEHNITGFYLKHGPHVYKGKGLLLGPNSPFRNIPLIGLIL